MQVIHLKINKIKIILLEILIKKNSYNKKRDKILSLLKKRNFVLIKKADIRSISLFSSIKGGVITCLLIANIKNSNFNFGNVENIY